MAQPQTKVLHLERSSFFQKIVKDIIQDLGIDVVTTSSAEEAQHFLVTEPIGIVISSLEVDEGSSIDFITQVYKVTEGRIPVIVITSSESLEIREKLFSLGVVDFILKRDLDKSKLHGYIQAAFAQDALTMELKDLKIAVLDDSPMGISVVRNIFSFHQIDDVEYFQEPIALLERSNAYDLYIIDLVLPQMSGERVVQTIRERSSSAMIIVISSVSNTKTISHVLLLGADDYIIKPFDQSLFMARIKANLRNYLNLKKLSSQQEQLKRMARTDSLTGLLNHKAIHETLNLQLEQLTPGHQCQVVIFDIDNFKRVNDERGHQIGDGVIVAVAQLALAMARELKGFVGRYGGEEFLLIVPNMGLTPVLVRCQELLAQLSSLAVGSETMDISVSGGIATGNRGENGAAVIGLADGRLYKAKTQGKKRFIGP